MKELLEQRQIEWLMHFTQADNLSNILSHGLLPRKVLECDDVESAFNDEFRYDECKDALCMSIEFPNYKMFYALRKENPAIEWAVLMLDAQVLSDFECAYCYANAGSAKIYNIPIEDRMGTDAFLGIFDDYPEYPSREELDIGDWYPTNPQAEVLVFDNIPVKYINKVIFDSAQIMRKYKNLIPDSIESKVDGKYFFPREDYSFWTKAEGV